MGNKPLISHTPKVPLEKQFISIALFLLFAKQIPHNSEAHDSQIDIQVCCVFIVSADVSCFWKDLISLNELHTHMSASSISFTDNWTLHDYWLLAILTFSWHYYLDISSTSHLYLGQTRPSGKPFCGKTDVKVWDDLSFNNRYLTPDIR